MCVCVCVCVCVRACVRACLRACVPACVCEGGGKSDISETFVCVASEFLESGTLRLFV